MNPVRGKGLSSETLALGYLILVMWKNQVIAATVDVNHFAEMVQTHDGALDVPAGPPRTPWAVPERLAFFCPLPQCKIGGIFLPFIGFDPRSGYGLLLTAPAEFAVVVVPIDAKIDAAIHFVGVIGLTKIPNGADYIRDFTGHTRVGVCGFDVKIAEVLQILVRVELCQFKWILVSFLGSDNDLIIHVGEIRDVCNLVANVFEVPADHIEYDGAHRMADVGVGVYCRPANIHANTPFFYRFKPFPPASQRIVDVERHRFPRRCPTELSC